jgi:hypothetical protein
MLLLFSGSYDGTVDRIVLSYGNDVFRFNYDLWQDYELSFTEHGWTIRDPEGREITSETVTAAYWWKAFSFFTQDDKYVRAEVKYTLRDIYGWCQARGLTKGNSIDFHNRLGKMTILGLAVDYFSVPDTLVTFRKFNSSRFDNAEVVAKSLASELTDSKTALMTTQVDIAQIDPSFPWYLQSKIDSAWDVTVFYCDGQSFAFRRSRAGLTGLDWRSDQNVEMLVEEWEPMALGSTFANKILNLSNKLGVEFGRYDFMTVGDTDDLVFLEFNANGQWVFLDPFDKHGLLDCVTNWLRSS